MYKYNCNLQIVGQWVWLLDFYKDIIHQFLFVQCICNYMLLERSGNKTRFWSWTISASSHNNCLHHQLDTILPNSIQQNSNRACSCLSRLNKKITPTGYWTIIREFVNSLMIARLLEDCKTAYKTIYTMSIINVFVLCIHISITYTHPTQDFSHTWS